MPPAKQPYVIYSFHQCQFLVSDSQLQFPSLSLSLYIYIKLPSWFSSTSVASSFAVVKLPNAGQWIVGVERTVKDEFTRCEKYPDTYKTLGRERMNGDVTLFLGRFGVEIVACVLPTSPKISPSPHKGEYTYTFSLHTLLAHARRPHPPSLSLTHNNLKHFSFGQITFSSIHFSLSLSAP